MFLKNIYLRKTLNRAGLLPKEKCFQISDIMRMFWKLWKLIFFILRKLETFPFKCRLPEWAPRDSFHSRVIVLVGSQETARTSRVATEKPALCKGSRVHRFEGQWKVGTSGQREWHFLKSGKSKQFFCPLTFCSPSENLRHHWERRGGRPGFWHCCTMLGSERNLMQCSPVSPFLTPWPRTLYWASSHTFKADRQ